MTEDVEQADSSRPARRRGQVLSLAAAAALLIGGGTAVAVGLSGPEATPVPPSLPAVTATQPDAEDESVTGEASSAPSPDAAEASAPAPTQDASKTSSPAPTPEPSEQETPVEAPVSVSIPAIDVTSDLLHLGLDDDGSLEVPQGPDFDSAAWYDGSPKPGETGPAVILGHVSSAADGPSVFFDLGRLEMGDTVEVTREDGTIATFEIYDLQQFPKDEFPTVQVYGNTSGPELRVITCGGTIAESTGHFSDNIIIFAREA